jgi:hypothetical protein
MDQLATTDPDGLYTPNALSARLRELTGGRSTIGPKMIRAGIACGDLPASRLGKRWLRVRWVDFESWIESKRVHVEPSITKRVEQRVDARLRRESRLRRG